MREKERKREIVMGRHGERSGLRPSAHCPQGRENCSGFKCPLVEMGYDTLHFLPKTVESQMHNINPLSCYFHCFRNCNPKVNPILH